MKPPTPAAMDRPRVAVASEFRVNLDPRLGPLAPPPFGYEYWAQLFAVPLPITLVLRGDVAPRPQGEVWRVVAGPNVDVVALPSLRPSLRLLTEVPLALWTLWHLDERTPLVLRMPGIVPTLALGVLSCRRRTFSVHVVGDPMDVAFKARVGNRLAPVVGVVLGGSTWLACRRAEVVAYVTEAYLQRRYPPGTGARVHAFSNVRLGSHRQAPRKPKLPGLASSHIQLVTVGSLEQPYKRVDLLLEALAILRNQGWSLRLQVAGAGAQIGPLRELAERLGVAKQVCFRGTLDTAALQALLLESDLFVLCSDTEGMPRALIEAMAANLPCVSTAVGGVPELLPPDALCRANSVDSLVGALRRNLVSASLRQRNATRCGVASERFRPEALDPRRRAFIRDVIGPWHGVGRRQ